MALQTRRASNKKVTSRAAELSTRDRILEASRELFNRDGVQGTAMFRIASHLSISPGNLTYHFQSKSDIVRVLAIDLEQHIVSVLNGLSSPVPAPEVVSSMEDILQTLWSCRFFFNSALFVSRMDADLADKFQQIYGTVCSLIRAHVEKLVSRREMRAPAGPDGIALIADNVVAVWLQWLRLQAITTPSATKAGKTAIGNCLRHHFALMTPYMSRSFTEVIRNEVDRRYFG